MIDEIYNKDVLRLAGNIGRIGRLEDPVVSVTRTAPLCGSGIVVDLGIEEGLVTDYAQEIKACALGQAAASVIAEHVIGADLTELGVLRDQMAAMLAGDGPPPEGKWAALAALAPAKSATSRHGAIMLAVDAAIEALEETTVTTGPA